MKILVTGSNGFLGHHVTPLLKKHELLTPSHKDLDLIRPDSIKQWLKFNQPEAIIHLAAKAGGIGLNMKHPAWLWRDNLLMGIHILEMASQLKVKKLVMVGTTCSYPKNAPMPFREDNIWDGYPEKTNAPYAIAKRSLLAGAQAYRSEFGVKAVTLIPTNLYGEWDKFNPENSHVIPALIKKIDEAKDSITLWGTGKATRDFLYAGDCAVAMVKALEVYDSPEPVNLGSGLEISIGEVALTIAKLMKKEITISFDTLKPDGQPKRVLDSSRAKKVLGWQPNYDLKEGLERTIAWYQAQKK